jgi:hypothetical protein
LYAAVWSSRNPVDRSATRLADGIAVDRISTSLDPASRILGNPERLAANAGISFIGSYVLGMGFTMDVEQAQALIGKDPRNTDALFPYLGGQDIDSRPDCSASRW